MLTLLISLDILSPSLHPPTYPHTHTPAHTLTQTRTQIHTHFQNCQDVFCIFILLNLLHTSKMVWLKPLVKYIIYMCVCVCVCVCVCLCVLENVFLENVFLFPSKLSKLTRPVYLLLWEDQDYTFLLQKLLFLGQLLVLKKFIPANSFRKTLVRKVF